MPILKIPFFTDSDYNFQQNLLDYYEILLVPIYWVILTKISLSILKKRNESELPLAKKALHLKFFGALVASMLFNLYYVGGDTNAFFNDGKLLNSIFLHDPIIGLKMFWTGGNPNSWSEELLPIIDDFRFAIPANTWIVCKFAAFFQFFCFRSMLVTSMLFATVSFFCLWIFYKKINELFPQIKKYTPWAILYLPSMIIWGSGIFKDTICISALAILFVAIHQIWFKRQKIVKWFFIASISAYLLVVIKPYIFMSFSISISIWLLFSFIDKYKNIAIQIFAKLLIAGSLELGLVLGISSAAEEMIQAEIEQLLATTSLKGQYLKFVAEKNDGSAYDIGTFEPTIGGFVKKIPAAVNVTLFRPYLWESKKIIVLFSALESTIVLLLFLYMLWRTKVYRFIIEILSNSFITFCFIFTVVFCTFVGLSSANFGALVRYKIPAMPFFLIMVFIIIEKNKKKKSLLPEPIQ